MKLTKSIFTLLVVLITQGAWSQLNLIQPITITGTAPLFTPSSTPEDAIVDPIVIPTTDPTSTTVSSYSDGSLFNNVYIWNLTANTITMDFDAEYNITGVAIWNAFASGAYLDPGFLEPDHSVNLANFEFFSGGVSIGDEDITVLFPDDAFGELYPLIGTYDDVDQVVMTVLTNHGGNETAMQEIAFNTTTCDDLEETIPVTEICLGDEITLEVTSVNGGTITWDGGITNGVPFTPAAAGTTTYTAISDDEDDCEFDIEITVHDIPVVTASVDETEICLGESITFTGGGADDYVWDMGVTDGIAFTPADLGTVTYTVIGSISGAGCENTASVDVTVNEIPTIIASVDDIEICLGESVIFTGSGGDSYVWDMGVVDGFSFTPDAVGTETYTVIGSNDASGCENTASIDVTVLSDLPVTASASDLTVCLGEPITFTGGGADMYVWDMGVTNGVPYTPPSAGDFTFNVVGTDFGGCSGISDITITVHGLPTAAILPPNKKGCVPFSTDFISANTASTYSWNFGDGSSGGGSPAAHTYTSPGAYDVTLTVVDINGCVDDVTEPAFVEVIEMPIASFSFSPERSDITDTRVEFLNTSSNATIYEWSFGDGSAISNDEHPIHDYPVVGNKKYTVTLIAENDFGCTDQTEQIITIQDALFFYIPNAFTPDGDSFNDSFKPIFDLGLDVYDYHLIVFNRWGETVFESYNVAYGWDGTYGNGEIVQDGVYTWAIEFGETMSDKKHEVNGHVFVIR